MHFELLDELVIIFLLSIVVNLVCNKIKLTATVGFLLTGVLCGPSLLGIVDSQSISDVAELGVAMLLFTIGMELSGEALSRLKRPVFLGGSLQIGLTVLAIAGLTALLDGTSLPSGIFWGCLVALSSSAIVLQIFQQKGLTSTPTGRLSLAILVFQDIMVAPMMLCVPLLSGQFHMAPLDMLLSVLKVGGILGAVLLAAHLGLNRFMEAVMRTRSRELLFLSTLGTCFGMALLTHSLGLSLSLGAFLAGLMLARSQYSMSVISGIMPYRDVFMSLFFIFTCTEYGPMKLNEDNAKKGDLFTTEDRPYGDDMDDGTDTRGHVVDLIAPVLVLIAACILGMIYTGGFFEGVDFVTAFADCNASAGLVMGSSVALLFTFVFYRVRQVMTFQDFAACIPEGFKAMVSPMLILSLAWTLSGMTGLLGAKYYVANLLGGSAAALQYLLPVIIFLVAVFLAFATGTSWGTFSILIPIVCHAFPEGEMLVVSIAACLSGAVCGDHCSPISDTTIMASAGAHCSHVNHVSTQLPYAMTVAACSAVCYVITGLARAVLGENGNLVTSLVLLGVAILVELTVLTIIRAKTMKKTAE